MPPERLVQPDGLGRDSLPFPDDESGGIEMHFFHLLRNDIKRKRFHSLLHDAADYFFRHGRKVHSGCLDEDGSHVL